MRGAIKRKRRDCETALEREQQCRRSHMDFTLGNAKAGARGAQTARSLQLTARSLTCAAYKQFED